MSAQPATAPTARPMARRRGPYRKAPERRLAVLAVAAERFEALGYAGASMSEIAAALGGSKGSLYQDIPSKAALLRAVVAWRADDLQADLLQLDPPLKPTAREYLAEVAGSALTVLTTPQRLAFLRLVLAEGGRFPDLADAVREACVDVVTAQAAGLFKTMIADGAMGRTDPQAAARRFVDLTLMGPLLRRLFDGRPQTGGPGAVDEVAPAVDAFLRAHAPERPSGRLAAEASRVA